MHADKDHVWHMTTLAKLAAVDSELFVATPYRVVGLQNAEDSASATAWWEDFTGRGGEGMVVKPLQFIARGAKGLMQPALKCRGRVHLRIIYSPEYDLPFATSEVWPRTVSRFWRHAVSRFSCRAFLNYCLTTLFRSLRRCD